MKNKWAASFACVFFGAWLLLAMHSHAAHAGDLHANHSACQICSASPTLFQKAMPAPSGAFDFSEIIFDAVSHPSKINFSYQPDRSYQSRAPPQ